MADRKKVLVITYYWPPAGGSGVQRWLKFAKYLRTFGWEPIILTPENGSYPMMDYSLQEDVPEGVVVYRTKSFEYLKLFSKISKKKEKSVTIGMIGLKESNSLSSRVIKFIRANLFIPDARIGWKKYAVKKAKEVILKHKIEVMVTTGPPHSAHLIGLELQKTFEIPWVADFRDPWVNIYYNKELPRTSYIQKKDLRLQNKVIQHATKVITVAAGLQEELELEKNSSKFEVIYNGYDESDVYVTTNIHPSDYFVFSHIGNFIPNFNVPALWRAIQELVNENEVFRKFFRLRFTGVVDSKAISDLKELGLEDIVVLENYVPHKLATQRMFESTLLLFVVARDVNNKYLISGKIFEYMASTTPILPIGPKDAEVGSILKDAGRDSLIDYEDMSSMKNLLQHYFDLWLKSGKLPYKYTSSDYQKFSRKSLTNELSRVLDEAVFNEI